MKTIGKRLAAIAVIGALAIGAGGCSSDRGGSGGGTDTPASGESGGDAAAGGECSFTTDGLVGVAMPTKSLERWNRDGADLQKLLEDMGYQVDLQYADNKPEMQISQLENMINAGAEVLVVASIDGEALGPVLETAAEKGIPVIAYDRLIKGTEAVDYYASFDNEKVGTLQGQYIEDFIKSGEGPYNFEMFAGSPDDNNARFFFKGAFDVLQPYLEDGTLVVQSGKQPKSVDDWQSIGIQGWDGSAAQSEMENRLNSYYRDKKVNIVLSPNDSLALGIAEALQANGYEAGSADYPILTGQDADEANVNNILAGAQSMTVWKDTRELGKVVSNMVNEIMTCSEVTVNNTEDYNNDVKVVPSYLLDPVVVTKENVKEMLVDSGFLPDLKVS
ncbi:multiple monosaccharide ABC transporter substrate-binding protein [Scrofimicrobium sp. R131]|uniref:Multiple monosaccharide ABC transporter substrate-binding protein n=1 Tax=Scrofimicrobium appendicitidis TaxID=3079930 RepID=A0AAU7V9E0_9ACTO